MANSVESGEEPKDLIFPRLELCAAGPSAEQVRPRYTTAAVSTKSGSQLTYKVRLPHPFKVGQCLRVLTSTQKRMTVAIKEFHTTPMDNDPTVKYFFLEDCLIKDEVKK